MKKINKAHKAILNALINQSSTRSLTSKELVLITGQSFSGLRSRITEMRKLGYDIRLKTPNIPVKKYYLISEPPSNVSKILDFIEEKNLFDHIIKYSLISNALNISIKDVDDAMAEIFKTHIVIQISKESAIIKRNT